MTDCPITLPSRYEIEDETGGGQGVVFICNDSDLDRKVVVKCLKDVNQLHRLADEIRALQTVRSKHVVEIYDLIIEGDNTAIVLEYISGEELTEHGFKSLAPLKKIKVLYQIACGISDIHSFGHIHRDIKPHNMRIDDENIVKIFDFGLSRQGGVDDHTVGFRGTRGFAAPELYVDGVVPFTAAADVYAFSASVWFLAIDGFPPELIAQPPKELLQSKLSNHCNLPPSLADLIDKGLDFNPVNRPSMDCIRDVLGMYLLEGQHQGVAHFGQNAYKINAVQKTISIGNTNDNSLKIHYDGLMFFAKEVTGNVFINNTPVTENMIIPQSCVIAIGIYGAPNGVSYIAFDVSHPEVVL